MPSGARRVTHIRSTPFSRAHLASCCLVECDSSRGKSAGHWVRSPCRDRRKTAHVRRLLSGGERNTVRHEDQAGRLAQVFAGGGTGSSADARWTFSQAESLVNLLQLASHHACHNRAWRK